MGCGGSESWLGPNYVPDTFADTLFRLQYSFHPAEQARCGMLLGPLNKRVPWTTPRGSPADRYSETHGELPRGGGPRACLSQPGTGSPWGHCRAHTVGLQPILSGTERV